MKKWIEKVKVALACSFGSHTFDLEKAFDANSPINCTRCGKLLAKGGKPKPRLVR